MEISLPFDSGFEMNNGEDVVFVKWKNCFFTERETGTVKEP
jgi:hypothetical protein